MSMRESWRGTGFFGAATVMLICTCGASAGTDFDAGVKGAKEAVLSVQYCAPTDYQWPNFTHSASITQMRDGRMAAVWYGGKQEGEGDCKCYFSRYKEGQGWETPKVISSASDKIVDNSVIFQAKKAGMPLVAYYKLKSNGRYRIVTSTDNGDTWSEPKSPPKNDQLPTGEFVCCDTNQPVELPDGSFLHAAGTSGRGRDPKWWVERSTNLVDDMTLWSPVIAGAHQPAFLVLTPDFKKLQMIGRGGPSYLSEDMGKTWKELPKGTAPKSGFRGDAKTLDNGWHVNVATYPKREQVNVSLSRDGTAWQTVLSAPCGGKGYPTITQAADRKLHMLYSDSPIRHVVLDLDKLVQAAGGRLGPALPADAPTKTQARSSSPATAGAQ